jgi:hypothetical protein
VPPIKDAQLLIILMNLVHDVPLGALFNAIFYFSILLFALFFEQEKLPKMVAIVLENGYW